MSTAIAIPEPIEATLVPSALDPFDTLTRYLKAMAAAREFADVVCMTPMVPKFYQGNPKAATVAILHGAELGLHPLQSLQQIFVVHGMPAIYARTMVALLKSKGFRFDTVETGPERVVFTGTAPNGVETETSTWTIERADRAGYIPKIDPKTGVYGVNKNGNLIGNEKYITEPENMLWAKAAAEVCRRLAPDVLLGISRTVEDIESEPEPVHVKSERVSPAAALGEPAAQPGTVIEWPSEPSESGTKPDTAQVTPSAKASPEGEEDAPAGPPSTRIQQRKIARLFDEQGVKDDSKKLLAAGTFLGREITSAADISRAEAIRLLEHLEEPIEPDSVGEAIGSVEDWATEQADLETAEQDQADGGEQQ